MFCAALTTICELVLPLIMRYITNEGMRDLAALSVRTILVLGAVYLVLRIIDSVANYYMAYVGHVMGAKIETVMRSDAYAHLQKLSNTYYNNTKVGQIMGRITNDLFDVTEFSHHCPEEFFIAAIKGTAGFIILAGINFWLTLMQGLRTVCSDIRSSKLSQMKIWKMKNSPPIITLFLLLKKRHTNIWEHFRLQQECLTDLCIWR